MSPPWLRGEPGSRWDFTTTLREKAAEVLRVVSAVPGVSRAFIDRGGQIPQLQIAVDRRRASRYGLNVADVEDVIETALGSKVATDIWEGERRFGVAVRLREQDRRNVADIGDILVDTPEGPRVPLQQVADISVRSGNMNISRESGTRLAASRPVQRPSTRSSASIVRRDSCRCPAVRGDVEPILQMSCRDRNRIVCRID